MNASPIFRLLALLIYLAGFSAHANTSFSNVDIESISLSGKPYYQIEADLSADFVRSDNSHGAFSVPISMLVPQDRCNQTAIVDVVNSVLFEFPETALGHTPINFARLFLGDDFISGRQHNKGFSYVAVQWNKSVTDESGTGHIERGTDGYIILETLTEAMRDNLIQEYLPSKNHCKTRHVIGFGWSQTGKLLAEMLTEERNGTSDKPVFDGLFLGVAGGICRSMEDSSYPWSYHNCDEPPVSHVPVVAFNTQSEVELAFGSGALRTPSHDLAIYDYAGLAHIDARFLPFDFVFADLGLEFQQNPVSVIPGVRASFWNLYLWVRYHISPAESQLLHSAMTDLDSVSFLDIRGDASLASWSGGDIYSTDIDQDDVADSGIRLPHMASTIGEHQQYNVGAPLGVYGGIDFNYAGGPGIFFANGGTFQPYSEEELAQLYPTKEEYMNKVRGAAYYLVFQRYLLPEDARTIIEEANQLQMSHWE
ncbi:alpha/beta hydrolase domain-containing protein [Vibrio hannami]|uniref:alpha/beta hydrolase domain-containing protein n=1 Tax=Vibrio hannami TaxID=2717094 RepID=UPI00240FEF68|nr:alpha/beta hydrolase domain-containing protein [Vibrio hannami]MDG3086347.1 alpha/beta hydrolase domain-containing protein [Vibrio hannami]